MLDNQEKNSRSTILVVEDDGLIADRLVRDLTRLGYDVVGMVASGKKALQKVKESRPDVVLMDIYLAGAMNGIDAAAQIRARFDIPVIYLTAYAEDDLLQQAIVTESYGYLVKPTRDRELCATIEMALYRHGLETRLKESERRLDTTLRSIGDAVIVTDDQSRVTFMNPVAETLTGWQQVEALGRDLHEIFHIVNETGGDLVECPGARVIRDGASVGLTNSILLIRKDGTATPIDNNTAPIQDERGNITGVVLVFRDITEHRQTEAVRRQAEEALRKERDFVESLIETAQTIILVLDTEGRIVRFNPYMEEISGYRLEQVQGKDWFTTFLPQHDPERIRDLFLQAIGDIQTRGKINSIITKDGHEREIEWYDKTLKDAEGNVIGILAIGQDVTEHVQAQEELERLLAQIREQAERVQQIIDSVPEGVLLLDAGGCVVLANLLGKKDLDTLAGARVGDTLTHLGDCPLVELLALSPMGTWREVMSSGSAREQDADRSERHFEIMGRPLGARFEYGDPQPEVSGASGVEGWVLVIRDVTQRREIQQRAQQQDLLAAVGQLAAGIAHDFNNILAVITLYTRMSLRSPNLAADLVEQMEIVDQEAWRASELVQQILDFSRRAVLEQSPMDLLAFLKEQIKMLERTLPESISMALEYGEDEYAVNADPTRMQQALLNLVVNARDAMAGEGELRIGLERIQVQPGELPRAIAFKFNLR
ncbi:MAG: PAS domain S-box protein [Chloroflexi bacterium]|nr:PAS domain S-box protein [Chloroflexota bacterium]